MDNEHTNIFDPKSCPSSIFKSKEDKIMGTLYLLKPLLERMKIANIIDSIVPSREENGRKVSTGKVAEVLVANRLSSPCPMESLKEWANIAGVYQLFGVPSNYLNDDRIARTLKEINDYFDEIQTALVLHTIKEFDIDPSLILWDTTAIYFEGDYSNSEHIDYGHGSNKNKKQIKLAFSIDAVSGIPLLGSLINGSKNDQSIVPDTMLALLATLKKKDILFTGDKAVGTIPNCLRLHHNKIQFVAPCPTNSLFESVIKSVSEEEFAQCTYSDNKGNIRYKVAERGVFIECNDKRLLSEFEKEKIKPFWARCLLIWSSSKAQGEKNKRDKAIRKIEERLTDIKATKLNIRKYKKLSYAQSQVENCFKGSNSYLKKVFSNPIVVEINGKLSLDYKINKSLLKSIEQYDGIFPVVTNVFDSEAYPLSALFDITRKKYNVERPMRYIKSETKIRPMFLHLDEHINGLVLASIISLMGYCILEHLGKTNINKKTTAFQILKKYTNIVYSQGELSDGTPFQTLGNVAQHHMEIIRKLGLDIGVYSSAGSSNH